MVFARSAVEVGSADSSGRPALASNTSGKTLFAISELPDDSAVGRVRAYFDEDFRSAPLAPSAPRQVAAVGSRDQFVVSWVSTATDVAGFLVERSPNHQVLATAAADERSLLVRGFGVVEAVSVRAFNAGGFSEPSESVAVAPAPRRRPSTSRR
jgi:hypothetical protein